MQSLSRALTVLAELRLRGVPCSLVDISDAVGLHKSTVHRMLATFCEHGLVRRVEGRRYVLGDGLTTGCAGEDEVSRSAPVESALARLAEQVALPVVYAVRHHAAMRVVAAETGPHDLPRAPRVGDELSLGRTALGRAYLASLPRSEIDAFVEWSERGPAAGRPAADAHDLLRDLAQVRAAGFAVDHPVAGPGMVAVPVPGPSEAPTAALGVQAPPGRAPREAVRLMAAAAARCARTLAGTTDTHRAMWRGDWPLSEQRGA